MHESNEQCKIIKQTVDCLQANGMLYDFIGRTPVSEMKRSGIERALLIPSRASEATPEAWVHPILSRASEATPEAWVHPILSRASEAMPEARVHPAPPAETR